MFEQSIVQQQRTKPWTFGVSMTLQAAVVGALMLLSVSQVQKLGMVQLPPILPPTPRLQDAVKLVPVPTQGGFGVLRSATRPFLAPTSVPKGIARIEDIGSSDPDIGVGRVTGDPNGVPYGDRVTGIQTSEIAIPKPPPTPTRTAAVELKKDPMRVNQGVMEAMLIHRVIPAYPPIARTMRLQGKVHLEGIIGTDGTIQRLRIIDGPPILAKAALEAVKQWIYRPTLLSGQPVEVITPIEVNFVLTQ